jgi:hypothetical protein
MIAKDLVTYLPIAVFVLAFLQYAFNSYRDAQVRRRDRAVKAADEIRDFLKNDSVSGVLRIFDHGEALVKVQNEDGQVVYVNATRDHLRSSLQHHSDRIASGHWFDFVEVQIRQLVDEFLHGLERIEVLIREGVIDHENFGELFSYWLKLLAETPLENDLQISHLRNKTRERLWEYIRRYEFNGVVRLFRSYDRAAPIGTPWAAAFEQKPEVVCDPKRHPS